VLTRFSLKRKNAPALRQPSESKQGYEGVTRRLGMVPDGHRRKKQKPRVGELGVTRGFCLATTRCLLTSKAVGEDQMQRRLSVPCLW
jgi:hypothetical protein